MTKKGKALKGLLILALIVALCMYFSKTIQTITTPKVKLVQATTGRIEQKISVSASPYFPVKTEVTLNKAVDYPITVDKVYVSPGLYVEAGDTLFTASVNDYDTKEKDLRDKYTESAQKLIDLDIANRKSSKQSQRNDLYDTMLDAQDALTTAESDARLAAAAEGIDLTFDQETWAAIARQKNASDNVMGTIAKAATAKETFNTARDAFYQSYENAKLKVTDAVFKYINDRNAIIKDMHDYSNDMVKLLEAKQTFATVKADSAGYIVAMDVKENSTYDGKLSAYTIAKKEDVPVLRADITDLKKEVTEGAKVEVEGDYDTFKTKVTGVVDDTDGRKYAEMELTDDILKNAGGMSKLISSGSVDANIVFRSKKNATLIPASALRSEGEGNDYIFVVDYSGGGFLSSGGMVAKKTTVTVIDRGDKAVSIQEDLGYQQIIERADRTVEDGKPVMEYVE
ncbi:MAG TPA: hypothetical protein PLP25_10340 [Candidatus Limiplasma sp.]|nr:hypothetical protein [Candidatus Limiplasma sp.]HPS82239.1 hypothetical protein [Candidatus Limiplasma sp.]